NSNKFLINNTYGTKMFFSPESFTKNKYDGKMCDIWALGITFYIILFGKHPFNNLDTFIEIKNYIINNDIIIKKEKHIIPELYDLLCKMLCKEPSLRITTKKLLEHPFLINEN